MRPVTINALRTNGRVQISLTETEALAEPAEVWLVSYDPAERRVAVGRGDNRGEDVAHYNVVTQLTRLDDGGWSGGGATFTGSVSEDDAVAVIVQSSAERGVLAAKTAGAGEE